MFPVHVEIPHALAAEPVLQRLRDVAGADAHQVGFVAVDRNAGFGFAEFQVDVGHLESRVVVDPGHELRQYLLQFFEVGGL